MAKARKTSKKAAKNTIEVQDQQPKEEYAALKEDFDQIIQRGIEGFQEKTPGRVIENVIVRMQGRYGIVVQTDKRGLIQVPAMSGVELDNQSRSKKQRMVMGLNCSSATTKTAFNSVNLLRYGETTSKEFEINASAHELLKKSVEKAQKKGELWQRKVDEEEEEVYPRVDTSGSALSVNLDTDPPIQVDQVFSLVSLARQTLKQELGSKLKDCKITFFSICDTVELSSNDGAKIDSVIPRTGFIIKATTQGRNNIIDTLRGVGGMSAICRYDKDKTPEEVIQIMAKRVAKRCIDMDRAQPCSVLGREAHVVIDGEIVGVLAHEVYGHTSEADIILDNKQNKDVDLNLKARLGGQVSENAAFNIVDFGMPEFKLGKKTWTHCYGGILVDEEGVVAQNTELVKKGIQTLTLNSANTINEISHGLPDNIRKEIAKHGCSGNVRNERYDMPPMIRMTNTFIVPNEKGPNSVEELAAMVPKSKKGVYLVNCAGGWVEPDTGNFEVTGQLGYLIENGIITDKPVKDVVVRGNITKFGSKIKAIGSSETMTRTSTGYCVGGDTPIITPYGLVAIKDINVGDQVFTHEGRFRTVKETFKRTASNIFKTRPSGGREFFITGNHEILTKKARNAGCWWKTKESEWVPTSQLSTTAGDATTWRTYATMPILVDQDTHTSQHADGETVFRDPSKELFELIGWYLAEGNIWSVNGDVLGIDFSDSATAQQAEHIQELAKTLGWKCYSYDRIRDNKRTYSVRIAEPGWAILWSELFGRGAEEKKLPPNVYAMCAEYKEALLRGYWQGDGSCSTARRRLSTATASSSLAGGLMLLLGQLGIYPGYTIETAEQINARKTTQFKANYDLHRLEIAGTQAEILRSLLGYASIECRDMQHHIHLEDKFLTRIQSIEPVDGSMDVYNLHVDEDNSYVTPGMALHNCGKNEQWVPVDDGGPAMLCEDVRIGADDNNWFWQDNFSEYKRQMEEVAVGRRKKTEVYFDFIEDATEGEATRHANLCMLANWLPGDSEIQLLLGDSPDLSDFALGDDGELEER